MSNFLTEGGKAHFGRIAGIAQHPDGSLLVADDANGVLYRVSYGDGIQRPQPKSRPARRGRR